MKAWDERIQAIENNLTKTTDLAEKNSNRLHTREWLFILDDERLDKLENKEEEATATLQIVEINLNKLEPRAGAMEKRMASIEQDISSKVKPRFNVLDAKIADLSKKLKEGGNGSGDATNESGPSSACKMRIT